MTTYGFGESFERNRLKNTLAYLCGPMDRVEDGGITWRRDLTPKLQALGVGVLDPSNKPTDFVQEDSSFRDEINYCKKEGTFDSVKNSMRDIAAIDLRMVDIAHFIIMNLDVDNHLCGSYHEAFLAVTQKKPVIVRCKQGKKNLPNWMFGVVPHQMVFSSWSAVLEYLHHINEDENVEHLNRWRFFDFNKVYGND